MAQTTLDWYDAIFGSDFAKAAVARILWSFVCLFVPFPSTVATR
jgi:hypothetical protein